MDQMSVGRYGYGGRNCHADNYNLTLLKLSKCEGSGPKGKEVLLSNRPRRLSS